MHRRNTFYVPSPQHVSIFILKLLYFVILTHKHKSLIFYEKSNFLKKK